MISLDEEFLPIQVVMKMLHCLNNGKFFLNNAVVVFELRLLLAEICNNCPLAILHLISWSGWGYAKNRGDDKASFNLSNASCQFADQMNFSLLSVN